MRDYKPYPYQKYCSDRIVQDPAVGLFLDMGLGKTAITLSAIKELKYYRWCVYKVLIIAPKKVAEATWVSEAAMWRQFCDLTFSLVLGSAQKRVAALEVDADVYIINRENVSWLVEYYGQRWPFDMVVIDESSSFKNHQAKRFKSLKMVRGKISRMVALTGTPCSRSLMDLWAQVYLLDRGARLGRTISAYRDAFFVPDRRNQTTIFSYAPREGAEEAIYAAIGDICVSMKAEDYLALPELMYEDVPIVLDAASQKAYRQLERDALLQVSEDEIVTAGTAAVLSNKLLQLCNGAVYNENGEVTEVHGCKLEALLETVEQLGGQHALICYNFKHDLERILTALRPLGLNVRVYHGKDEEEAWNRGEIDLLLVQPASCGYGLNLQRGGHHVIWFGLTWSLELYQQTNKRLHRQGQTCPVIVHHLVVKGGVDEDVIRALDRKEDTQESLMQALKARIQKAREDA